MRSDKFKVIEAMFAEHFNTEAAKIKTEFERMDCFVGINYPPNDDPDHGFFMISLDCLMLDADVDKSDCLTVYIDVNDHNDVFTVNAGLSWASPFSKNIGEAFPENVPVSDENLKLIKEKLPDLFSKTREEIQNNPRGKGAPI
jgi:hypothetical protein